jgi:hypothetical protein
MKKGRLLPLDSRYWCPRRATFLSHSNAAKARSAARASRASAAVRRTQAQRSHKSSPAAAAEAGSVSAAAARNQSTQTAACRMPHGAAECRRAYADGTLPHRQQRMHANCGQWHIRSSRKIKKLRIAWLRWRPWAMSRVLRKVARDPCIQSREPRCRSDCRPVSFVRALFHHK